MKLGFALPQFGGQGAEIGRVAEFARHAERAGAHSLWVGDRLLAPVDPVIGYAGSDSVPSQFDISLDPFAVLTVAATATETALLGSNVLNLPWYPPAGLARSLTAIDLLSGGRLRPGFGLGWSPEEYAAMNVPFSGRGLRLDEGLDALEALWTANPAEYHGQVWTVPATRIALRPVRRPPIYLAAFAPAALRRVGRRADGWLPALMLPDRFDPAPLLSARRTIDAAAVEAGRDPAAVETVLRVNVSGGFPAREIAPRLREITAATGVEHVFVDLMYLAETVTEALRLVDSLVGALGE
jgi:probable F420-dependent oxidoreductase